MTATTAQAPRRAAAEPPRDLRRLWRVLLAVVLPIGPLGVTVLRGIMPYWTSDDVPTMVEKSLADLGALEATSWLGLVSIPPLLASVLAIGYLARRGAPVLAALGAGITFLSFLSFSLAGNTDLLVLTLGRAGTDAATITDVVEASLNHPIAIISIVTFVIGHIVGMVLLAVALRKARVIPGWAAIALGVSQPVHLVAAVVLPSRALDVVAGWGLTTVGFAMVSVALLRTPDEEWDLPPVGRAPQPTTALGAPAPARVPTTSRS